MLRVWHPELTPAERDALQFVFDAIDEPDLVSGDGADDARLAVLSGYAARADSALRRGRQRGAGRRAARGRGARQGQGGRRRQGQATEEGEEGEGFGG